MDIGVVADEEEHVATVSHGRLAQLKAREAELKELLKTLRREKANEVNEHQLTIGILGFGNFGQFLGRTFI